MNVILSKKLSALNQSTDALLKKLEKVDPELLNKKPTESAWSVNQVMHHIMLSEKLSLQYCLKKIQSKELKKAGLMSPLKILTYKTVSQLPITFKAPKGLGDSALPEKDTIDNIKSTWQKNRGALENFLASLTEEQAKLAVYKHPAMGRISFKDMLNFFQDHYKIHLKQIERTLEDVGAKNIS